VPESCRLDEQSPYERGLTELDNEAYHLAISKFSIAIALNPSDGLAYLKRAAAYEKVENYESALADYRRALTLAGNDGSIRREIDSAIKRIIAKNSLPR
jgi:Flp pilus assembly protein TadD